MTRIFPRPLVLAAIVVALGGCSMFGVRSDYEQARETRPLEIPPELDAPAQSGTMRVPEVAGAPAAPGVTLSNMPATFQAGEASSVAVADGVAGTWRRVGLALERSGVAEITARDEVAATFTVSGTTAAPKGGGGGFISRLFSRDEGGGEVPATRVVRVAADGGGSVVTVEDEAGRPADDELARRLITAIRQRLG
ncbi:MAG: hypothetical protein ACK59M_18190 [Pseudomonadota bacterium]|jgi:uncharacterized lipoprotein